MTSARLPTRHLLLALTVVAVWGTNFVVIKAALDTLLLATLRIAFAFAPAALVVARPALPWRTLAGFGCPKRCRLGSSAPCAPTTAGAGASAPKRQPCA